MLEKHPELLEATKYQTIEIDSLDKTHKAQNTNMDVDQIPGLIASKTGYTSMAGGNLVIAFDASIGRPIIVVVLGSSLDGRFTDVSKLVSASQNYISQAN
jgi:D-alanyl-D-alanine carboxypeptidase